MKPVLLLVDDDPAVLMALQVEMRLAFGGRCDIEAFEEPLAVLDMLPRWRSAGRQVVLSVVDQRMPGCTGVELLRRMREPLPSPIGADQPGLVSPAATSRTVLLTAYGGPEAFHAAVHEGGVDLYREKPWSGPDLRRDLEVLLERGPRSEGVLPTGGRVATPTELPNPGLLLALLAPPGQAGGTAELDPEVVLGLLAGILHSEDQSRLKSLCDEHPELRVGLLGLLLDLDKRDSVASRLAFSAADVRARLQGLRARLEAERRRNDGGGLQRDTGDAPQ